MSRLAQIPDIPAGLPEGLEPVLRSMKQNLELLAGQRGADRLTKAVLYGAVDAGDLQQQSAAAAGSPPTKTEFDLLIADMESVVTRFNYLVAQLRGEDVGT